MKTPFNVKDIPELVKRSHVIIWEGYSNKFVACRLNDTDWRMNNKTVLNQTLNLYTRNDIAMIVEIQTATFGGFKFFQQDGHELKLKFFGGIRVI